jgi:hypothetical protein
MNVSRIENRPSIYFVYQIVTLKSRGSASHFGAILLLKSVLRSSRNRFLIEYFSYYIVRISSSETPAKLKIVDDHEN